MKTLTMIVLVLLVGSGVAAQTVPLPEALMTAKTAIVVNEGVNQDVYERLVLELKAWKRFALVEAPALADITIAISGANLVGSNWATGQTIRTIEHRVSFKQGDTILYSDALKGCCSLKAMTRKTLEKLDKRLRQKQ